MEKISKTRSINSMIGELSSIGYQYNHKAYIDKGYKVVSDKYREIKVEKNEMTFSICSYDSGQCDVDYSVYVDGKYYNLNYMDKFLNECGHLLPEYERPGEMQAVIDTIKTRVEESKGYIKNAPRIGEIGGFMRARGCYVEYDGFSVCTFEKDGICYNATYNDKWTLNDRISIYDLNGHLSRPFRYSTLDENAERYLTGISGLGRRLTEKDRIKDYKEFRVRTFGGKEIKTLKWFKTFEDANEYAKNTAKELYSKLPEDLKRYGYPSLRDVSDKYDLCAGYMWYNAGRGAERIVYVCGEDSEPEF